MEYYTEVKSMSTKVVEVKTLKVGKYVILDGAASKIVNIQTSSPGKHGAAKARLDAVGIFDNQKRNLVKPVDAKIEIPIIDKRTAQVLAIMGSDIQLMDMETYETFEVPIPDELRDGLIEGAEVGYIVAMGNKKLMKVK
jgi:translation initiation factor 5A